MNQELYDWDDLERYAEKLTHRVFRECGNKDEYRLYGVPRGGAYAALMVRRRMEVDFGVECVRMLHTPKGADFIIDDIIESGKTRDKFPGVPFGALIDKKAEGIDYWVQFPWELNEAGPEDAVTRILEYIGEDPSREGLVETPKRVVKSYSELFAGYRQNPEDFMKVFSDGACDEMVLLRDIEFQSCCEHHMLPFIGVAHVAYVPNGKVIGVSKLARLVDLYAKRLQIQERLCQQVTTALDEHLTPLGSACVIEAKHLCMTCRGVGKQNSVMTTSSLTGVFKESQSTRNEFLSMIRKAQ